MPTRPATGVTLVDRNGCGPPVTRLAVVPSSNGRHSTSAASPGSQNPATGGASIRASAPGGPSSGGRPSLGAASISGASVPPSPSVAPLGVKPHAASAPSPPSAAALTTRARPAELEGVRSIIVVAIAGALAAACSAPDKRVSDDPRGEVNGRSFEFVSTKPDGTEWTFRTRGNSLWVAVVERAASPTISGRSSCRRKSGGPCGS
jgi:hypothetical protein